MKLKLIDTADGSQTLRLDDMDETYHSSHGAITEAQYVYISNGLLKVKQAHINILEIGFGTGLNVLATLDAFLKQENIKSIRYISLEKYPVEQNITNQLEYGRLFEPDRSLDFEYIHSAQWNKEQEISKGFTLEKRQFDLLTDKLSGEYDLVYYDAFAPSKQAEMWEILPIEKVSRCMKQGALLTSYCAQGDAKRTFREAGLKVKRLAGPPGKWHMLNCTKL